MGQTLHRYRDGLLDDYCAAMRGLDAVKAVRAAVQFFVAAELSENEGLRKRFEELRQERLKAVRGNLHVLRPEQQGNGDEGR